MARQPAAISRRTFLRQAGAAAGALCLAPAGARGAAPTALRFVHLHTDERLSVVHRDGAGYRRDALAAVDQLLRDHRTGEVHPIDPHLLDLLAAVQHATRTTAPFQVISGYRSPATNATLRAQGRGVARRSLHMLGQAIDVRLEDVDSARLRDVAWQLQRGGVGYYAVSDFVHLDVGRVRRW